MNLSRFPEYPITKTEMKNNTITILALLMSALLLQGCTAQLENFELTIPQTSVQERTHQLLLESMTKSAESNALKKAFSLLNETHDVSKVAVMLKKNCPNDGWSLFIQAEILARTETSSNAKECENLYRSAHFRGILPATVAYGQLLQKKGGQENQTAAVQCFERACSQNNPDGCYELGRCYELGLGVATDIVRAFKLYTRAANGGNHRAMAKMIAAPFYGDVFANGSYDDSEDFTPVEFLKWGDELVSQGYPIGIWASICVSGLQAWNKKDAKHEAGINPEFLKAISPFVRNWIVEDSMGLPKSIRHPGFSTTLVVFDDGRPQKRYKNGAEIVQYCLVEMVLGAEVKNAIRQLNEGRVSDSDAERILLDSEEIISFLEKLSQKPTLNDWYKERAGLWEVMCFGEDESLGSLKKNLSKARANFTLQMQQKNENQVRRQREERAKELNRHQATCSANRKLVETAIQKALQGGIEPKSLAELVQKGYLSKTIRCPAGNEDYSIDFSRIDPIVCPNGH